MPGDREALSARIQAVRSGIGQQPVEQVLSIKLADLVAKGVRDPALLTLAEITIGCEAVIRLCRAEQRAGSGERAT